MVSQIRIADAHIEESNSGTNLVFTVSLDTANPTQLVTVNFSTANGGAKAGSDYTAVSGQITFPPNETTQTITIPIPGDMAYEFDETFYVNLSAPSANATIADGQGIGLILNDDAIPTLRINDVTVSEDNTTAVFTVTRTGETTQVIAVNYATVAGNAKAADGDYTNTSGTLFLLPNETSKTIAVPILGDDLDEANETFSVILSNPPDAEITAEITDAQGIGTITDTDAAPSLTITGVTIAETANGTHAVFTVSLSALSGQMVTVQYDTADNTAVAGQDYTQTSGTLTFNPGTPTQTITVPILDDLKFELAEAFFVNLSNAVNASIGTAQATGTITDNEAQPTLSIEDVVFSESDGGVITADFTVSLSSSSSQSITVDYATANDTATADADYVSRTGTLTFTPDQTAQTISIQIKADEIREGDEDFFLNLMNATGATIATTQATGTIKDDELLPKITIEDATVTEGNSGTATARFTVTLSHASSQPIRVNYAIANKTTSSSDLTAATGTVEFAAGVTSQTIEIAINGDIIDEPDEEFFVNLTNPENAEIQDEQGIGTITDDDSIPGILIEDISRSEGDETDTLLVTVRLSNPSSQTVEVDFDTSSGTATVDEDYLSHSGKLTFNPGDTSQTIEITVEGDQEIESDETLFVNFSNPVNATLSDNQVQITLTNDDEIPKITISDAEIVEGNVGIKELTFTVSVSRLDAESITVDYTTDDDTATTADNDYQSTNGQLTFVSGGATSQAITVFIQGNTVVEEAETFFVNLSNASANAVIKDSQGIGTINNDDSAIQISIDSITVTEADTDTTNAMFTVSLSEPSLTSITVSYVTVNGEATTADGDYVFKSGKLTFEPRETSKTITVLVNGDFLEEDDETFTVRLRNPTQGTIAVSEGIATIAANDAPPPLPTLSVEGSRIQEGNDGTPTATFTVSLSAKSDRVVTVDYATADDTATVADADYTAIPLSSLTFAPGVTTQTITVDVQGDTDVESDETFHLNLTNAQNAEIATGKGITTLVNDDSAPLSPNDDPDGNPDGDPDANPNGNPNGNLNGNPDTQPGSNDQPANPDQVANLLITGTANQDTLAGGDGDDRLYGLDGNDILNGGRGNDLLNGGAGDDVLYAGDGIDLLLGKQGGDHLRGGNGDDVLYGGIGNDRLYGEQGNDKLFGKKGTDLLSGGEGNDLLVGHVGRDRLLGGTGNDRFVFRNGADSTDRIIDFSVQDDTIAVLQSGFKADLKTGTLNRRQFQIGKQATDVSDRFIYNQSSGALFFDRDGRGGSAQIQIAQMSRNLPLTHQDIVVIAEI